MKKAILLFVPILFVACVSNSKYEKALGIIDSLKTENTRLIQINEELENGEARLAARYTQFVLQGKFIKAEETYSNAIARHPQAGSNAAYKNISDIRKKAQAQRDSVEKAVRDSLFLANIDDIGEWKIGNYVNDFKEPTGQHYVYQYISGKFSNSATAGSRLGVMIRIYKGYSRVSFDIEFDEYGDGTIDESYYDNAKAVCEELRKVYVASYRGGFRDRDNENDSKSYSLLDLLRMEKTFEVTDTHREYSLSTVYNFTINSQKLNNALVKAGILSVDDVLNNQ